MMTKSTAGQPVQTLFGKIMLTDLVDHQHELVRLADAIDWGQFEKALKGSYSADNGRPSCPVRMLTGLTMLRYMFGLSDQEVLDGWVENPYWQYFCGEIFFEHRPPTTQPTLSRWRAKLGESGAEEMLRETLRCARRNKLAKSTDFERVNVDTHVQEKYVRHPTDAGLLDRARERLVKDAGRLHIRLKRNWRRKGKQMCRKCSGYAKARQFKRLRRGVATLKGYLRKVVAELEASNFIPKTPWETATWMRVQEDIALAKRLLEQDATTPGRERLYSLHEPKTECIAKGKSHKHYEFGVKAGLVTSARGCWILGAKTFPGNPYDGHTLQPALEQAERIGGVVPRQACVDLGYRKSGYEGPCDIQVVEDPQPEPVALVEAPQRHRAGHRPRPRGPQPRRPLPAGRGGGRCPPRPADGHGLQPPQASEGAQTPLFVPCCLAVPPSLVRVPARHLNSSPPPSTPS